MAYNQKYNPDALPMHAEPDQAAQLIDKYHKDNPNKPEQKKPQASPKSNASTPANYQNKPPPPIPDGRRPSPQGLGGPYGGGRGRGGPPEGYGRGGPPDGYGRGGPPDGYGRGGPPDGYGRGGPPDGYGRGGPPDGYGRGGPPDGYGRGGPPPEGYGRGGPPDGYGRGGPPDNFRRYSNPGHPHYGNPSSPTYNQGPGYPPPGPHTPAPLHPHSPQPPQNIQAYGPPAGGPRPGVSPAPPSGYGGVMSPPPQINVPQNVPIAGSSTRAGNLPPGSDPSLLPLFQQVDVNGTGQLAEAELGRALRNDSFTSFDPQTVRMMIRMFDHDKSGTVGFPEFCDLWKFLSDWRQLFERFDEDRSGFISLEEYSKALTSFGYNLSNGFVGTMYRVYDRRNSEQMTFDLFVQSCISLKRMTDVFKRYDTDRDGYITLSFEEFITEVLNQR